MDKITAFRKFLMICKGNYGQKQIMLFSSETKSQLRVDFNMDNNQFMKAAVYLEDSQLAGRVNNWLKQLSFAPFQPDNEEEMQKEITEAETTLVVFDDGAVNNPGGLLNRVRKNSPTTFSIRFTDNITAREGLDWVNRGGFACFSKEVAGETFLSKVKPLAAILKNRQFLLNTHKSLGQKLRQESQTMAKRARFDGLTGLADKKHFEQKVRKLIAQCRSTGQPAALIVYDIDYFKNYNDTHGHPRGDKVLKKLAEITEKESRGDDFAGRIGGEEFGLFLPRADTLNAVRVARRLQKKIKETNFEGEEKQPSGKLTISQGIAEMPDHAENFKRLYTLADRATYQAKRLGRNRIIKTVRKEFSLAEKNEVKYSSVSVVGDFNSWKTPGENLARVSSNRWAAELPLPEGKQRYGFYLDNKKIIPDPDSGKKVSGPQGQTVTEIKI